MTQNSYPLDSIQNVRIALRKSTVQTAIYKKQAECGSRRTKELLAYIGFMTDEECLGFLNSIRKAPFIPGVGLMWTGQIAEYLMVDLNSCYWKFLNSPPQSHVEHYIDMIGSCGYGEPASYTTSYMKKHVDKENWDLLPKGWCAKYYSPTQVLRIAINFAGASPICQHMAEVLFIRAADLEDCISPITKLPPALTYTPQKEKVSRGNVVTLKDSSEGTHIAIDIPEASRLTVTSTAKVQKTTEAPNVRRNPVVSTQPMFAAGNGRTRPDAKQSAEINEFIAKTAKSFGGSHSYRELSALTGLSEGAISSRIECIKKRLRKDLPVKGRRGRYKLSEEDSARLDEAIRTRSAIFGGDTTNVALAKEFNVTHSLISKRASRIRNGLVQ